jgi:hypothetical protein
MYRLIEYVAPTSEIRDRVYRGIQDICLENEHLQLYSGALTENTTNDGNIKYGAKLLILSEDPSYLKKIASCLHNEEIYIMQFRDLEFRDLDTLTYDRCKLEIGLI